MLALWSNFRLVVSETAMKSDIKEVKKSRLVNQTLLADRLCYADAVGVKMFETETAILLTSK